MGIVAYAWADAELLSGEHLADHSVREFSYTAVRQEQTKHVVVKGCHMAVREEALSSQHIEREGNPVLLYFCRKQGDLEPVLKLENGGTVETVAALLKPSGLDFGRIYELCRNLFSLGTCDIGVFNGLDYGAEFCLTRVAYAFTLRGGVDYYHILLGDELLCNLVEYGSVDLSEKFLGQFKLDGRIHKRFVVKEVVNHSHYEFSVLAGVS